MTTATATPPPFATPEGWETWWAVQEDAMDAGEVRTLHISGVMARVIWERADPRRAAA